jgi:hypothetical protein
MQCGEERQPWRSAPLSGQHGRLAINVRGRDKAEHDFESATSSRTIVLIAICVSGKIAMPNSCLDLNDARLCETSAPGLLPQRAVRFQLKSIIRSYVLQILIR